MSIIYSFVTHAAESDYSARAADELHRALGQWVEAEGSEDFVGPKLSEDLAKSLAKMAELSNESTSMDRLNIANDVANDLGFYLKQIHGVADTGIPNDQKARDVLALLSSLFKEALAGAGKTPELQRELIRITDGYFRWHGLIFRVNWLMKFLKPTSVLRSLLDPPDLELSRRIFRDLRRTMRSDCDDLLTGAQTRSISNLRRFPVDPGVDHPSTPL